MSRHIFILAGSYAQALDFAKANKLWPQHWTFLYDENKLRGLYEPNYIKVGTWQKLKNIIEIERMLHERKAVECKSVTVLS